MKVADKSILKVGDLIWFHNWGVGGFLFGVIVECDEDYYHNTIGIWRAKSSFSLDAIDGIELIKKIEDVEDYALHDFQDFLNEVEEHNIYCNFITQ